MAHKNQSSAASENMLNRGNSPGYPDIVRNIAVGVKRDIKIAPEQYFPALDVNIGNGFFCHYIHLSNLKPAASHGL
jgi:hypothetical protein